MPPANRHDPKRAPSSESQIAVMEFFREFPDDEMMADLHILRAVLAVERGDVTLEQMLRQERAG